LARLGKYVQGGGFFLISDAWAAAHPDKITAAVEALWEAEQYVRDNPKEAADINAKSLKADPAIIESSSQWLKFDPMLDDFTVASLKQTSSYLLSEKIIAQEIDVDVFLKSARAAEADVRKRRPDLLK
jgi:ABC-type nitrate/sulfonate/bicarbonate transport system substrate-binding protein